MESDNKPGIIILGAPRSGTTLLRRVLDAHPHIACPGETFLLRSCARFLRSEAIVNDLEFGIAAGMAALGMDMKDIHARLRGIVEDMHLAHARSVGKERWAEKTAVDAFYIDEIEALYGDRAKFLCIIRHGMDVVASMHDLTESCERFLEELYPYLHMTPYPSEAYAHAWRSLCERMLRFADDHPDNVALLRYEDLVGSPEETLQDICTFLEEPWEPEIVRRALSEVGSVGLGDWKSYDEAEVHRKSVGRWRTLSQSTLNRVGPIVNELLHTLEYELIPTTSKQTSEEAMRRYCFAMMEKNRRIL